RFSGQTLHGGGSCADCHVRFRFPAIPRKAAAVDLAADCGEPFALLSGDTRVSIYSKTWKTRRDSTLDGLPPSRRSVGAESYGTDIKRGWGSADLIPRASESFTALRRLAPGRPWRSYFPDMALSTIAQPTSSLQPDSRCRVPGAMARPDYVRCS